MRAPYLHPEFGYFCPTPGLRRTVKVALAFTVIGALAGAGGMAALIADHDSNIDGVAMAAHADMHGVEQRPGASAPAMVKAEAIPTQADTAKPAAKTAAKSETGTVSAKVDITAVESAKPEATKVDATKPDAAKAAAAATACDASTWSSLDGSCGSGQVRKMRMVRVPAANRTSAAATSANQPVATAVSASSQSKPPQGVAATAARTTEPAHQVSSAKKPQKVAAGQSRRRDQAASAAPPRPEVSPLASGAFGGFFGMLR